MGLIILTIVILAVIGYFIYNDKRDFASTFDKFLALILFTVLTITITFTIGRVGNTIFGSYKLVNTKKTYEIVSLNTKSRVSGSFILGCGSFSQDEYYFTFIKIEDNIYKRKRYSTKETRIHETNTHKPKVIKKIYKEISSSWFFPIWLSPTDTKYTLKVPKGTIIKEFSIGERDVQ